MAKVQALISTGSVERRIFPIRGINVMLDEDLAVLYRVETRVLIQAVKRNPRRFPADFHVPVVTGGVPRFDITAWILAEGAWRSAAFPVCLHRAGRGHALKRPA
jgi:ORF6N domain